jgi:hypothetical protein
VWKRAQLPVVGADFTLLRPVFVSLISNAIQVHAPATRRKIEIAAARQTSDEWGFSVRDNSVGVDPENGSARFSGRTLAMNSKAPALASPTSAASSCAPVPAPFLFHPAHRRVKFRLACQIRMRFTLAMATCGACGGFSIK